MGNLQMSSCNSVKYSNFLSNWFRKSENDNFKSISYGKFFRLIK